MIKSKVAKKGDYVGLYLFDTNKFFFRMEKEGLVVGIEADGGLVGFWGPKGTLPGGAMVVFVLLNSCETGCCGQYNRELLKEVLGL